MRRLLKKDVRTSMEVRGFRDHLLHNLLFDEKHKNGDLPDPFAIEADGLLDDVMKRLSFLRPIQKAFPFNGSVYMRVGIYSDDQHDLDTFAHQLGFRSWTVAYLVYYALKMEDKRCGRR